MFVNAMVHFAALVFAVANLNVRIGFRADSHAINFYVTVKELRSRA